MDVSNLTRAQRELLREVVQKMNVRRRRQKKKAVTHWGNVPPPPSAWIQNYYLVDTYVVKRHWRTKPHRKAEKKARVA